MCELSFGNFNSEGSRYGRPRRHCRTLACNGAIREQAMASLDVGSVYHQRTVARLPSPFSQTTWTRRKVFSTGLSRPPAFLLLSAACLSERDSPGSRSTKIQKFERESSEKKQSVHFIGIGGSGISALAFHALKQGWLVSGSDISCSEKLEALRRAGARVHVGHKATHLWGQDGVQLPDYVVISSAIPSTNEELVMAEILGVRVYKRGPWLAKITKGYDLIAVSGSHGKSTTTAMLGVTLSAIGHDISAIVGADVPQFTDGGSVLFGRGREFVLEADEYDGCFLSLSPYVTLVTNIEWEHVDMFPSEVFVRNCFKQFSLCLRSGGALIFCGDDAGARSVVEELKTDEMTVLQERSYRFISYGFENRNSWRAVRIRQNQNGDTDYDVVHKGRTMASLRIQLPGLHNVLNSLAVVVAVAVIATEEAAADPSIEHKSQREIIEAACISMGNFIGIRRRFEFIGVSKNCHIYDDYAHHPTEVHAVLNAARQKFGKLPIWVVFQPHTYSRLARFLEDFAMVISSSDYVIVTQVYSARETNAQNINGLDLVCRIRGPTAFYIPNLDDVLDHLLSKLAAKHTDAGNVVVLTLGAGDISTLGPRLLQCLQQDMHLQQPKVVQDEAILGPAKDEGALGYVSINEPNQIHMVDINPCGGVETAPFDGKGRPDMHGTDAPTSTEGATAASMGFNAKKVCCCTTRCRIIFPVTLGQTLPHPTISMC